MDLLGFKKILIKTSLGDTVTEKIPAGPSLVVKTGQEIKADDPLTTNPNVGGFGQIETEIVLQNPARIQGMLAFFVFSLLTQVMLVLFCFRRYTYMTVILSCTESATIFTSDGTVDIEVVLVV